MPFVRREDWDRVQAERDRMARQLSEWEALRPFLEIAKQLQISVVELLETDASVEEIGELALKSAMAKQAEKAKRELATAYEREHRHALYTQVLEELKAEEGPSIMADVVTRLESNPDLATELRDSARKELTARAEDVVKDNVTRRATEGN